MIFAASLRQYIHLICIAVCQRKYDIKQEDVIWFEKKISMMLFNVLSLILESRTFEMSALTIGGKCMNFRGDAAWGCMGTLFYRETVIGAN